MFYLLMFLSRVRSVIEHFSSANGNKIWYIINIRQGRHILILNLFIFDKLLQIFLNSPSNGKFVRMLRPYDSSAILLFFLRYYVQVQVDHTTFSAVSSRQALGFPTRTRQNYKLLIKGRCKNKLRGYPFSEWVWLCACAHTIFGCIFLYFIYDDYFSFSLLCK